MLHLSDSSSFHRCSHAHTYLIAEETCKEKKQTNKNVTSPWIYSTLYLYVYTQTHIQGSPFPPDTISV